MSILNTIVPAAEYRDILLEIYKKGSQTSFLDGTTRDLGNVLGANEIKLKTMKVTGFGKYVRDGGFKQGKATIGWETVKLEQDRGVEFLIDRVDSMETLNTTIGDLSRTFVNTQMIPEIDAYRFSRYAKGAGFSEAEALTAANFFEAVDKASAALSDEQYPEDGRVLFVNQNLETMIKAAVPRQWANEGAINTNTLVYNGLQIRLIPQSRFNATVTLSDTSTDIGFTPGTDPINFLLIYPGAIWQAVKVNVPKFISADDTSNRIDSHIFNIRLFHDANVLTVYNKGVYASLAD